MTGILHPKCGKRFPNGKTIGHCGSCCETFIGLGSFDAHRVGSHHLNERRCEIQEDHWQDDRGYWHVGARLTDEQKAKLRPKEDEHDQGGELLGGLTVITNMSGSAIQVDSAAREGA